MILAEQGTHRRLFACRRECFAGETCVWGSRSARPRRPNSNAWGSRNVARYLDLPLSQLVERLSHVYCSYCGGGASEESPPRELGDLIAAVVHKSSILNYAGIPSDDLCDVKQVCATILWKQMIAKSVGPVTLKGFIRRVLGRAIYRYWKKQHLQESRETSLEEMEALKKDPASSTIVNEGDLSWKAQLDLCLDKLTPREKLLLDWIFVERGKASTLAKMWNLSDARITQIKQNALRKLQTSLQQMTDAMNT